MVESSSRDSKESARFPQIWRQLLRVLFDAHVHIQPCFNLERFLIAAGERFAYLRRSFADESGPDLLFLVAPEGEKQYVQLFSGKASKALGTCRVSPTPLDSVLAVALPTGKRLFLVSGMQRNSSEGIELLFYNTLRAIPERASIAEMRLIARNEGIPCALNWAPGKWLGERGKIVLEAVMEQGKGLLLCDTALRPQGFPAHPIFAKASALQVPVVYGSDPLNFPSEDRRAASLVTELEILEDDLELAALVPKLLSSCDGRAIGERLSPLGALSVVGRQLIRKYTRRQ